MKIRATIAAIGTAAALGVTGTILLPAAAGAGTVSHTLTFTSVQQAQAKFSATVSGSEGKDVNKAGKVIGFDVLRFAVNPQTGTASIGVALDTSGGFLYGVLQESGGPVSHGTVTGGTGAFAGAAGTITATSKTATRTAVTITYHT
jgi:hypothetical protein